LDVNSEEKRRLGRPRRRWLDDNTLYKIVWYGTVHASLAEGFEYGNEFLFYIKERGFSTK